MKIWIDISNAPHVRFFKDVIKYFENEGEELVLILTAQEAEYIAELRSKERHSLFGKARKERIAYEKMLGMPYSQKEFKIAWIYICAVITLLQHLTPLVEVRTMCLCLYVRTMALITI